MIYIGIDNGVTGSVGVIDGEKEWYMCTPVFKELSYQKSVKRNVSRINHQALMNVLGEFFGVPCRVGLERPLVNSKNFQSTCSAMRSLESTLIILERFKLSYEYIDSGQWQKMLLPPVKGSTELKKASTQIGLRLFPHLKDEIEKRGDADGILIAEYLKRR